MRPTVHSAVLPAITPESCTDFFGLLAGAGAVSFIVCSPLLRGSEYAGLADRQRARRQRHVQPVQFAGRQLCKLLHGFQEAR